MLLNDFIKKGIASLEGLYPSAESRSIVLMLCESILGTKSYTHIIEPQYVVAPQKEAVLEESLSRLSEGEPIQYVLGKAEFFGFQFRVTKDVLIPRPETEQLCRVAVDVASIIYRQRMAYGKKATPVRILDLCTGSGCIAWVLALSVPGAKVVGVDISDAALSVASSQNFASLLKEKGCTAPVFVKGDLLGELPPLGEESFDLILSNPPYILDTERDMMRKNVLDYEPSLALFVPDEDPMRFNEAIARHSKRLLTHEGLGMTEINETLGEQSERVYKDAGFSQTALVKDIFGKNRFVRYRK